MRVAPTTNHQRHLAEDSKPPLLSLLRDLDTDGVVHSAQELDVGAVELPRALADPQHVSGAIVVLSCARAATAGGPKRHETTTFFTANRHQHQDQRTKEAALKKNMGSIYGTHVPIFLNYLLADHLPPTESFYHLNTFVHPRPRNTFPLRPQTFARCPLPPHRHTSPSLPFFQTARFDSAWAS